jgi:hypothetical protein
MEKYLWYRYRLVNDFMLIGDDCGMSIPAQKRNYLKSGDPMALQWEDATVELGHYIGALAVEYRMLKDNNLDTWRTEQELYYAIRAFDRLDQNAETYNEDPMRNTTCTPAAWGTPFTTVTGRSVPLRPTMQKRPASEKMLFWAVEKTFLWHLSIVSEIRRHCIL